LDDNLMNYEPDVTWLATSTPWPDAEEWVSDRDSMPLWSSKKARKKARKRAKRLQRLAAMQRSLWPQAAPSPRWTPRPRTIDRTVVLEPTDGKLRLIFTDFDGVLNQHASGAYELAPAQVSRLERLAAETGAVVVVSSWWRWIGVAALRRDLAIAGFTGRLIGRTPWLGETDAWDARERGTEIDAVLAYLGDRVESFVILDDHNRMGGLLPSLVQTVSTVGLTDADVERARAVLLAPPPQRLATVTELVDVQGRVKLHSQQPLVGAGLAAWPQKERN
jgi:hypothetical protein